MPAHADERQVRQTLAGHPLRPGRSPDGAPRQSPCAPADVPTTGLNLWARRESGAVNMACAWVAVVLTTLEL